jgi:hypothetical protein
MLGRPSRDRNEERCLKESGDGKRDACICEVPHDVAKLWLNAAAQRPQRLGGKREKVTTYDNRR